MMLHWSMRQGVRGRARHHRGLSRRRSHSCARRRSPGGGGRARGEVKNLVDRYLRWDHPLGRYPRPSGPKDKGAYKHANVQADYMEILMDAVVHAIAEC
jgi:hypothetical protein